MPEGTIKLQKDKYIYYFSGRMADSHPSFLLYNESGGLFYFGITNLACIIKIN